MSNFFYNTLWHQHTSSLNTIVESIKSHLSVYINLGHKAVVASFGHIKHSFIYIYIYVYIHVFLKHPCRFHTSNSLFACHVILVTPKRQMEGRKWRAAVGSGTEEHQTRGLKHKSPDYEVCWLTSGWRSLWGCFHWLFLGLNPQNISLLQPLCWLEGCGLILNFTARRKRKSLFWKIKQTSKQTTKRSHSVSTSPLPARRLQRDLQCKQAIGSKSVQTAK